MATLRKRGRIYYSDFRQNGKRVVRALSSDQRIAIQKLGDMVKLRDASKHGHAPGSISWANFKERFKESRQHLSRATRYHDSRAIRLLDEHMAIRTIEQVTTELLDAIKNKWIKAGRGRYVTNRDIRSLKGMMRKAEAWGLCAPRKWETIKYLKEPKGRLRYFSEAEIQQLLNKVEDLWKTIILLGARAGLRRSEIHWLAWEDIDFKRRRLHVVGKDGWQPKDFEERWIPLSKSLLDHLAARKRASGWVLGTQRPTVGSMTEYFKRIARKARVEGSIHILRHTFASHLVSAGADLYMVSKLMGHSSVEQTQIYAHLAPEAKERAVDLLP